LILHIKKPNPDFPIVLKINLAAVLALKCKIGVSRKGLRHANDQKCRQENSEKAETGSSG
jgi:hypothetical protein